MGRRHRSRRKPIQTRSMGDDLGLASATYQELQAMLDSAEFDNSIGHTWSALELAAIQREMQRRQAGGAELMQLNVGGARADVMARI